MTQESNITNEPGAPGNMTRRAFAAAGIATTATIAAGGTAEAAKPGEIDRLITVHQHLRTARNHADASYEAACDAAAETFGKMVIRGPLTERHVRFNDEIVNEIDQQFKIAPTYLGRPATSAERQKAMADIEAFQSARKAHAEAAGCKAAIARCDEAWDADQAVMDAIIRARPASLEEAQRKAAYVAENADLVFDKEHIRWIIASLISPAQPPDEEA